MRPTTAWTASDTDWAPLEVSILTKVSVTGSPPSRAFSYPAGITRPAATDWSWTCRSMSAVLMALISSSGASVSRSINCCDVGVPSSSVTAKGSVDAVADPAEKEA